MNKKAIVSLSGGMDSSVLLAHSISLGWECQAVGFQYGSKHNEYEHEAGYAVANHYNVPFRIIPLHAIMQNFKSALMERDKREIPEGHYEAETMRDTVVPGRNMIFLAILAAMAQNDGYSKVLIGVHAGDHHIYPDCRAEFITPMSEAIYHASGLAVQLHAPFLQQNKTWIVGKGLELKVPFHLTRTCYKDQPIACGKCGSCQERLEAFENNGEGDPIEYESRVLLPKS